jgi:hypothetical protein
VFHFKGDLKALLMRCGVSEGAFLKYETESKFKIMRSILTDLDQAGQDGIRVQHRIVNEFAQLRTINANGVEDVEGAKAALLHLKKLASQQPIMSASDEQEVAARAEAAKRRQITVAARSEKLIELKSLFSCLAMATNAEQARGYNLEGILHDLFELFDIAYLPSYKTGSEQTDGLFDYKNHHYLVEARWRKDLPGLADLRSFREKIRDKHEGSRGVFLSIVGFRDQVVTDFRQADNPVLLMDGRDLIEILEERVSLSDALDAKLEHAAKTGNPFYSLYGR